MKSNLPRESPLFDDEAEETAFSIGDRVVVDGSKLGTIAFMGEVDFAADEWAGVALDEPQGQHNGTIDGNDYFQCEPLHGMFVRPHRLSRSSSTGGSTGARFTARSSIRKNTEGDSRYSTYRSVSRDSSVGSADGWSPDLSGFQSRKVLKETRFDDFLPAYSSGRSSVPLSGRDSAASSASSSRQSEYLMTNLRVGDRVCTNTSQGLVTGALRFMGETSFSDGQWAGIELDEPSGKNDGSVMGQRYFSCKPNCGLFVPAFKVSKEYPSLTITRVITKTVDDSSEPRYGAPSPTAYYTKKHDVSTHRSLMNYDTAY